MIDTRKKILCVDWDRRSVRLVVAKVGRVVSLEDAHAHRVPEGVDVDDPQSMGELLASLLRRHQLRMRRVAIDVARDKAVINRLTLPPTPMDEVAAAVQFQAMRELPFPLDQAVADFVVIERNDDNMATEVLLAAVRADVLGRLKETCRVAGLTPVRVGLRPYANLEAVRSIPDLANQRVVFVDVGLATTEIDVIRDGVLSFSRSANVAAPEMPPSDQVEDAEGFFARVEEQKLKAVRDLEVEITRTLQAYRAAEPGAVIDRIVIAGGAGLEEGLLHAVDQRFGLPCELYDPTGPLGVDPEEGDRLRRFSAALGLAWGLGREGMQELDFLNPKRPVPKSETLKRRARTIGLAAGVAVAAAGAWYVNEYMNESGELETLMAQRRELQKTVDQCDLLEAYIDRVVSNPDPIWLDHLLNITERMKYHEPEREEYKVGERLLVTNLTFDANKGSIAMTVLGKEEKDFARYVEALNSFPVKKDDKEVFPYRAKQGASRESDNDAFPRQTTLEIELLQYQKELASIAALEKKRASKLKEAQKTHVKPFGE